jgi:hypothetical protein
MSKRTMLSILISVFSFLCISSCSTIKEVCALYKEPNGFISFNESIQIESKKEEQFAKDIQNILPLLVDSIELKLDCKFKPTIFICSTNESFCKYSGAKFPGPRAKVTAKGFYISPRLQGAKDWCDISYHELVHVAMYQYLGAWHYFTIPLWFHEGIATFVSNGGGSGDICDSAAIYEILKGNHFYPYASFIRSYLNNDHLSPWMEYRQYMLFVKFLKDGKEEKFKNLLNSIYSKKSFAKSINASYGVKLPILWDEFINELKKK